VATTNSVVDTKQVSKPDAKFLCTSLLNNMT